MFTDKDKTVIFVIGFFSVAVAVAAYFLPELAVRVWFAISVLATPIIYWIGYRIGTKESRSHLSGMKEGVSTVTQTADKLNARRGGIPSPIAGWEKPPPALPRPRITSGAYSDDNEVIDL
ncbi:MAG: hypothetical protein KAJ19_22855 [Gammaproteobacteria bacterium]|nr:hypothetical protein [Gammaproteobacteria bacterium]